MIRSLPAFWTTRLGDAELVDAGADDFERAIDRSALVGYGALGLIDLEREVHPALQIESTLQRDAPDGVVDESPLRLTRSTTVRGNSAKTDAAISPKMMSNTILQTHAAEGVKGCTSRLAFKVTGTAEGESTRFWRSLSSCRSCFDNCSGDGELAGLAKAATKSILTCTP